jgi:hypothetical protein
MNEPETSQESELVNLEQSLMPHAKVDRGTGQSFEDFQHFRGATQHSKNYASNPETFGLIAANDFFPCESTQTESDHLGKRLSETDFYQYLSLEDATPELDPYLESLISKTPAEEAEEKIISKVQQIKLNIPPSRKRQKQSRDYILNEFSVCIPDISFSLVSQACKLLQKTCVISDKRRKQESLSVQESFHAIKLGYVLSDSSNLIQGLDVLSPRGFSILKKLAFHDNKSLKDTLRVLLNRNKKGETAKIQLLTQEIAFKLCQEHEGRPLISFITRSLELFITDFQHSLISLTSCADILQLSKVIAYLVEAVFKNAPAIKAFLNHLYTLILRNKARLEIQNLNSWELTILNNALESISEACKIYEDCFKENPLEFNQTFWNQCDSFSGGGLVLYIEEQTLAPRAVPDCLQSEDYTCDRMADRQVLATEDSDLKYKEDDTSGVMLGFQLEEEL